MTSASEQTHMNPSIDTVAYTNELREFVESHGLQKQDVCLVGSATLAVRGIRKNSDIDVCLATNICGSIEQEHVELARNKYEHIGISDEQLLSNSRFYDVVDGYKIVRPEIEYSHKKIRQWQKDQKDIERFEQLREQTSNWDPDLERLEYTPGTLHLLRRGINSLQENGIWNTVGYGVQYLHWHGPLRGRKRGYSGQPTTILGKALKSFRQDGLRSTLARGVRLVKLKEPTGFLDRYTRLRHKAKLATLAERKLDLHYPTGALLTEQYEGDTFRRMDLLIRLLAVEALLEDKEPPSIVKTFENETGYRIGDEIHALLERSGHGDPRPRVPVSYDSAILDGNALATSLARSPSAPRVSIVSGSPDGNYDRQWFENQNFSDDEIKTLDDRYTKLLYETNTLFVFILWPPAQSQKDEIVEFLRDEKEVHFTTQMSFADEEFAEFIRALYESQADLNMDHIEAKIDAMDEYEKVVTVGGVEVPDPRIREGFSNEMIQMKERVRAEFTPKILRKNPSANLIIHATDNYDHNCETINIIELFNERIPVHVLSS